jgi:hypothetical protein
MSYLQIRTNGRPDLERGGSGPYALFYGRENRNEYS